MIMLSRRLVIGAIALAASSQIAAAPRLLVATRGDEVSLLLPISHYAVEDEIDTYLDQVIEPAFEMSSEIFVEMADTSTPGVHWAERCPGKISEETAAQLRAAVAYSYPKSPLRIAIPAGEQNLSEFESAMILQTAPQLLEPSTARPPVFGAVLARAPKPVRSIESADDFHTAFCTLSPEQRDRAIRTLVSNIQSSSKTSLDPVSSNLAFREGIDRIEAQVNGTGFLPSELDREDAADGTFPWIVVARSQTWVPTIAARSQQFGIPMYVLGYAHFSDTVAGPGLIGLLRKAGFEIGIVQDEAALHRIFEKAMRHDLRVREPLSLALRDGSAGNIVHIGRPAVTETRNAARDLMGTCLALPKGAQLCTYSAGDGTVVQEAIGSSGFRSLTFCNALSQGAPLQCQAFNVPPLSAPRQ